eukprot:4005515-Alexandrium_andersonii.AAC.1
MNSSRTAPPSERISSTTTDCPSTPTTPTGRRRGSWSACASCSSAGGIRPTGRLRHSTLAMSTSPAAR